MLSPRRDAIASVVPTLPKAPLRAEAERLALLWQLFLPLLAATVLMIWLENFSGNQWIADGLYRLGGGQWLWREHPITSQWIHPGGKYLSLLIWFGVFVAWWKSRGSSMRAVQHAAFGRLLLATVLATLVIALLKSSIALDCPWDLQRYGGDHPHFGLFSALPADFKASGCFPAGHASAGYCWVAAWFTALTLRPRLRWWLLAAALGLGLVFGISQQLRGAHFVSHDVASLMICWLCGLGVHRWFLYRSRGRTA